MSGSAAIRSASNRSARDAETTTAPHRRAMAAVVSVLSFSTTMTALAHPRVQAMAASGAPRSGPG